MHNREEIENIEGIFQTYGISISWYATSVGPRIMRCEFKPKSKKDIEKYLSLKKEILYAMKSLIPYPTIYISNEQTIILELEKKDVSWVYFKDCIKELEKEKYSIPIILGKDVENKLIIKDLKELGSILISGHTRGGKSVFLNSVVNTILLTKTEKEVKLLFIDPKMVEMSIYENIPHKIFPIIHDTKKALNTFTWCIEEIERRKTNKEDKPYIVIVADEYADTMLSEFGAEEKLCNIASNGKEVGIYVILSTSKASDTVITEKLKDVIKTRIAFAMISKTDSSTLLDEEGAEELLGNGDMIFKDINTNEKLRIQAPFISTEEIENIVKKFKTKECKCDNPQCRKCLLVNCNDDDCKIHLKEEKETVRDEQLYERVKQLQKKHPNLTTNILQRGLQIGYNKAVEILREINNK